MRCKVMIYTTDQTFIKNVYDSEILQYDVFLQNAQPKDNNDSLKQFLKDRQVSCFKKIPDNVKIDYWIL